MKNILLVEQNQDGTVGGSHYCLLRIVECLDRSKYNPFIMFYEHNDIQKEFSALTGNIIIFPKERGKRFKKGLYLFQKSYNFFKINLISACKLSLFIFNNKIDFIHLNNSITAGIEWLLIAKLLRKKCITHERGWVTSKNIRSNLAKYYDKIICVSSGVQEQLLKVGIKNNNVVIYDGIDYSRFQCKVSCGAIEMRKKFVSRVDIPFIGMVGNFQEWKGQMTVVNAVKILKDRYPELVCLFVGNVSRTNNADLIFYNNLITKIEELNLNKNIILTGYRSDIPNIVNSFDLFIHASISPEPFGMVLLEAMCLKKAVIATDIGGPKEIIENNISGLLVTPGDSQKLAKNIEFLLGNKNVRDELGCNALKRVKDKFNLETFSIEINKIYDDLI